MNNSLVKEMWYKSPLPVGATSGEDHTLIFVNPELSKSFPGRKLLNKPFFEAVPELQGQIIERLFNSTFCSNDLLKENSVPLLLDLEDRGELVLRNFNVILTSYIDDHSRGLLIYMFNNDIFDVEENTKYERQYFIQ